MLVELAFHAMGGGHPKLIDDFYTDNKLFHNETGNCVIFIGICDFWPRRREYWHLRRPGDVWRRTGGHKVAVWLLKCDYYEIQVKCCIHCLIVCLAHFDNFHNEQQSERKIQGLTTNQSGSCRRKKLPKDSHIFPCCQAQVQVSSIRSKTWTSRLIQSGTHRPSTTS